MVPKKEKIEREKYMEVERSRRRSTSRKGKKRIQPKSKRDASSSVKSERRRSIPRKRKKRIQPKSKRDASSSVKSAHRQSPAQKKGNTSSHSTVIKDDTQNKYNELSIKISTLNQNISGINNKIQFVNKNIVDLDNRISNVRRENYAFLTHLEKDYASLIDLWDKKNPVINNEIASKVNSLLSQSSSLESQIQRDINIQNASILESQINEINNLRYQLENYVDFELQDFNNDQLRLSKDLVLIEKTLDFLKNTSIKWKVGEHPVLSVRSHDLNNDIHGILTLTNHRMLFEEEKEIILKKRFLIVTEKKTVRSVQVDQPIGAIEKLTKGKVGFLKGSGVFVTFKPELGLPEHRFDTNDNDVNNLIRSFNYIISGLADEDLEGKDVEETDDKIIQCPYCSAPYNKEVYRGQTSLECRYCGTSFRS